MKFGLFLQAADSVLYTAGVSIDCIDHFHGGTYPVSPPFHLCLVVRVKFPHKQEDGEQQEEFSRKSVFSSSIGI